MSAATHGIVSAATHGIVSAATHGIVSAATLGIGIEGALAPQAVAELAALAERSRYGSFWLNVPWSKHQPIECLNQAIRSTKTIEIGVGVFPLDAYPAPLLAEELAAIGASMPRVIIGIAAGQIRQGVIPLVRGALTTLRRALPNARLAIAGYGPKVLHLGGSAADVMLANWLTPERLDWFLEQVRIGANAAGRTMPPVYLYHRAATGPDAVLRLRNELTEYRRYPVHQKHQAEMNNPEWIGIAAVDRTDIARQLAPYGECCQVVLKPLPKDGRDVAEWRSLVEFFAPRP